MEGCEGRPGADEVEMVLCMAMVCVDHPPYMVVRERRLNSAEVSAHRAAFRCTWRG